MKFYRMWQEPSSKHKKIKSKEVDELCQLLFPTDFLISWRGNVFYYLISSGGIYFQIESKLSEDNERENTIYVEDLYLNGTKAILSTVGFGMPLKTEADNG